MGFMKRTLREHLAEVMGLVGYIQKDGANGAQGYRYASAEAVLKRVNAELSARGICIESQAELLHFSVTQYEQEGTTKTGASYKQIKFRSDAAVRLTLTFECDGHDGAKECVTVQGLGQSTDVGDKAVMKANTAAIKYCLTNAFLISWGDDPEADAAGDPPAPAYERPSAEEPKAKKTGIKKAEF